MRRACGRNGWDYIISLLIRFFPSSLSASELDLELGLSAENKKDHLSALPRDIWFCLIRFLTIKEIYALRGMGRQIKGSIDAALKFDFTPCLKKFQKEKLPNFRDQLEEENKYLIAGVFLSSTMGAGLQTLSYEQAYKLRQATLASEVQNGWTYSVSLANRSGFDAACQIQAPATCEGFSREIFRLAGNQDFYSENKPSWATFSLRKGKFLLAQREFILFGINLITNGSAYYTTRKFLHYTFANNPGKKVFYGVLAFSSHVLSIALPYVVSEKWANADALFEFCSSFSEHAAQYYSYLPNFRNFTVGGPWPLEGALTIVEQIKFRNSLPEVPLSVLPAAVLTTGLIIGFSLWRAKVRERMDAEINECQVANSIEETAATKKTV